MRLKNFFVASIFLAFLASGCEKDEDSPEVIPPRDRGEQEVTDREALEAYLDTHFYNYEDFENPPEGFNNVIWFDTIAGAHADKTPLSQSNLLEEKTVVMDSVQYTVYVLTVREGMGEKPTFADSTFVSYTGELLNGSHFDNSVTPIWFDLTSVVPGFAHGVSEFKGATGFTVNPDNTVTWTDDYGIGAVFFPSGLGYFSNSQGGIPAYSPLIFSFRLYGVNQSDHDGDGIPSYMEDLNGDEFLRNDNTDGTGLPNYLDTDDDDDFIPTREEIVITETGEIEFSDKDGDGTPDYLDPDQ